MSITPKKHDSSQFQVASSNELKTTFLALFLIPGTASDKSILFPHMEKVWTQVKSDDHSLACMDLSHIYRWCKDTLNFSFCGLRESVFYYKGRLTSFKEIAPSI